MTPEGRVKRDITRLLEARGFWRAGVAEEKLTQPVAGWFFMPVNNGMGVGGIPDYILCRKVVITQEMVGKTVGLFRGIEAKDRGKEPTDRQLDRHHEIRSAGGIVLVIDDVNKLAEYLNG